MLKNEGPIWRRILSPPPGPNCHDVGFDPATGSDWSALSANRTIGNLRFVGWTGNVKPSLASRSKWPSVTGAFSFVTSNVDVSPRNVSVAVSDPDVMVNELVPSPVHPEMRRQSNEPDVVIVVVAMTMGSA
jgi:hypothetical protein